DSRGFLAGFKRVLVAVDDSSKGRFAARIAGLLAGSRGSPVTILEAARETVRGEGAAAAAIVKSAAAPGAVEAAKPVEVVERRADLPWHEAVAAEARKGYDLLVIGIDPTVAPGGGFHERVSRLAHGFPGSIAVIAARGQHEADPATGPRILVPVTGSDVSRRGAEVALALGKAAGTRVTALSVIAPETGEARQRLDT